MIGGLPRPFTYDVLATWLNSIDKARVTIENNTYLVQRGPDIAVRLHQTDVVTYHPDGSITLNSGGWHTVVTKNRISRYLPRHFSVFSYKKVWYLERWTDAGWERICRFRDGLRFRPENETMIQEMILENARREALEGV